MAFNVAEERWEATIPLKRWDNGELVDFALPPGEYLLIPRTSLQDAAGRRLNIDGRGVPIIIAGQALTGDYNANGFVEQGDLDLVLLHWGRGFASVPPQWIVDRPTTGLVDQAELDSVLLNWGRTNPAAASAAAVAPDPRPLVASSSTGPVEAETVWTHRGVPTFGRGDAPGLSDALTKSLDDYLFAEQEDWLVRSSVRAARAKICV